VREVETDSSDVGGAYALSAKPADVVRALAWLRAHPGVTISLDALADVAGVRPRTLEAHFRQFLGASPAAIARRIRLAHVRRHLASGARDVTTAAQAGGFAQPGRFAAEYRREFGELPSQTLARARRARRTPLLVDDEALRLASRALPGAFAVAPGPCAAALADVAAAQAIAPEYALPKAIEAWCLGQRTAQRFPSAEPGDPERSRTLADAACALAPGDALVLTLAAGALTLAGELEPADRLVERALAIDPWAPWAWLRRGWLSAYRGDPEAALTELGLALQLMPLEPMRHLACIGIGAAHFAAGRYDRAVAWVQDGVEASPGSFWAARIVAAAAAHAGARDSARRVVRAIRRKDPELTVARARSAWPFQPAFNERLAEGLARAGLPRI
jgi:AraC-like DNA-binding protein